MESLEITLRCVNYFMFDEYYKQKRVLVTGHTGFKGSWLCKWLMELEARVSGFSLDPKLSQPLFEILELKAQLQNDLRADLGDHKLLNSIVSELKPDVIFHLAAQPLVRSGYEIPVETFATNVMGTVHLLDAVRLSGHACTIIVVTTDKCYENREWVHSYREEDPMGGYDPYSASKGCVELVVSAWRRSFFAGPDSKIRLATARAGNVIGGGDWAADRIVPDCIRAINMRQPITVRNKTATRPWQHVLEPLSGYLCLASRLASEQNVQFQADQPLYSMASPFNFGPNLSSNRTVRDLVEELVKYFPGVSWVDCSNPNDFHEASRLNLAVDKAFHLLQWQPVWDFQRAVSETAYWYSSSIDNNSAMNNTQLQINQYCIDAQRLGLAWARQ